MLSILIPTYNYNVVPLVNELHKQCIENNIEFEIIALDDKSSSNIISINSSINKLKFTNYELSEKNNGIAVTRQLLVNKSKYSWVLLIDADMKLKDSFYISKYIRSIEQDYEVVFGGIKYKKKPSNLNSLLRWKYGKTYEAVIAIKRNKTPYKLTSAANMLIKKNVYNNFELDSIGNSYGMDIYFGPQLKLKQVPVLHIDNGIYHLGLESSIKYLEKVELGARTLLNLYNKKKIKEHENDLLKSFLFSKKTGLNYIFSRLFKTLKLVIKKNLLSENPIIILLQFYKIFYICYYDLNQKQNN